MSNFTCKLEWKRNTSDFLYDTYDRTHQITFPGGISYKASAAAAYKGKAEFINPEESLLAALSSCHMLTFLAIAAHKRLTVDSYIDQPTAELRIKNGKLAVVNVCLRPKVIFNGNVPTDSELNNMHHKSHDQCFIANTVNCDVRVES